MLREIQRCRLEDLILKILNSIITSVTDYRMWLSFQKLSTLYLKMKLNILSGLKRRTGNDTFKIMVLNRKNKNGRLLEDIW